MADTEKGMKPIWHFVGLILLAMGALIAIAGVYYLFNPTESTTVLKELHPNLWWGGLMMVVGLVFLWKNKNVRVE